MITIKDFLEKYIKDNTLIKELEVWVNSKLKFNINLYGITNHVIYNDFCKYYDELIESTVYCYQLFDNGTLRVFI